MTDSLETLSNKIGYKFVNESLLATAMRHSSWTAENDGFESNERLDIMFRRYPEFDEGKLTDLRKIVVNMTALSRVATQLGLGEFVLLGRGEAAGGGHAKSSILANALEAVFGAVYLDSNASRVYEIVQVLLVDLIDEALGALKQLDAKSQLQELAARSSLSAPEYRVTDEGPDHAKMFFAAVYIGNDWMGAGSGRSKKVAEEEAAQQAITTLRDV
ncbi:MAG: ribonuclease III [Actinobacteria bacterium]|nr:ribonuclease III [Actinomycetota bacterium]